MRRAKALAEGNLRTGKAVFYVPDWPQKLSAAQALKEQLAEIGLEVEIRKLAEFATASAYRGRLGNADEPWDLAIVIWTPDYVDPSGYINRLLDAQSAGGTNLARFDDGAFLDLMRQAARQQGSARDKAYAALDLQLGRDAAPLVPIAVLNEATLVSARTGCLAAPARARAHDRLPEALGRLHRHPDEPVADRDPGRRLPDVDRRRPRSSRGRCATRSRRPRSRPTRRPRRLRPRRAGLRQESGACRASPGGCGSRRRRSRS